MSGQDDPYSRLYWRVKADERFEHVYSCDVCWAAYTRLLMDAEASYPSPASIPRHLKAHARTQLLDAGIIELRPHECFVVHGLQKERERRGEQARAAASARWSGRSADALPTHSDRNADPMLTEPSLTETKQDEPSLTAPPNLRCEPALDAYQRFYITPSKDALVFLDELAEEFGQEWTARAIGEAGKDGRGKLLSRAKGLLVRWMRQAEKDEAEAEQQRLAEKRAPLVRVPVADETPEQAAIREAAWQAMHSQIVGLGLARPKEAHP